MELSSTHPLMSLAGRVRSESGVPPPPISVTGEPYAL